MAENPTVPDVPGAFRTISRHGAFLSAWDDKKIEGIRYTRVNIGKKNRAKNHLQGIQRLRTGKHLAISGGDVNEPASHIFIVRMESRDAVATWGSNVMFSSEPPDTDKIVKVVALDRELWHAGGISVLGDVIAVPIENGNRSRIVFLHVENPEEPRRFPSGIERPDHKATAVALTRVPAGRFVCAVLWGNQNIDFYRSISDSFHDGFEDDCVTWRYRSLVDPPADDTPNYQSIHFLVEDNGSGADRQYFLVAFENTSPAAPHVPGRDIGRLYSVEGLSGFAEDPTMGMPRVRWLDEREFLCRDERCNLAAAGGIYVDPSGALNVYGAFHWRIDDMIRLTEFRNRARVPAVDKMTDAWIELYEGQDFGGRCLTILGERDSTIEDYSSILVQGARFNDTVSSVAYQLPEGSVYRLYKNEGFDGDRPGIDHIDLIGTGEVRTITSLAAIGLGDMISSSRFLKTN